jgi:deoxyribodipyrimidine photo-lyase
MSAPFVPTRAAGLARLAAFAPHAGTAYAEGRNHDRPEGQAVSALSPYLRHRLVLESEAVQAAQAARGAAAQKFVDEVFWRTYWKGWLEGRAGVWTAYRQEVARGRDRLATEGGLRRIFHDATEGTTGIDGFDDWARALVRDNWLHNHARMWFASIWIFTLRLPWALGADFFLRHLLDGDPASNTLSWRWVAGLHTRGKHYVARAENIRRYTDGRFDPAGLLDEDPAPLTEERTAPPHVLPPVVPPPRGDVALLMHEDDLAPETLDLAGMRVRALGLLDASAGRAASGLAEPVARFVAGACDDAAERAGAAFGLDVQRIGAAEVGGFVADCGLPVVTAYAPVGPAAEAMAGSGVVPLRRAWDAASWPHAGRGFFQLRERIPAILREAG